MATRAIDARWNWCLAAGETRAQGARRPDSDYGPHGPSAGHSSGGKPRKKAGSVSKIERSVSLMEPTAPALSEGNDDDVRRFIDVDELIELWPDLWLPPHARQAWSAHLCRLQGIDLA